MTDSFFEPDTVVATLPNGVRVLSIVQPHLDSASVSVFVRTGSRNEPRALNGISHFVEHMAFKGTRERDCQQINLDAERLGADVNAHTDKDHTAFHMRGLAEHAGRFVQMLGDIVRNGVFPAEEVERERQVILQEYVEEDDDALAAAYKLFDKLSFAAHPVAQPVIGTRASIERIEREHMLDYVQRQYTGANLIVGVAGRIDPDEIARQAEAAFGAMPRGDAHAVPAPAYQGGLGTRRQSGSSQSHVVLGFPIPALGQDHHAAQVAAALFGEGMSSPLMDRIRERRGLVYYAACSADVYDLYGQFVIEASMAPENLDAFLEETISLLRAQAERIAPVDLERAHNQIIVRQLGARERPYRRLEDAAQDLFAFGRVRSRAEQFERVRAVDAAAVRAAFERLLDEVPSLAMAGRLKAGAKERAAELAARHRLRLRAGASAI